MSTSPSRRLRLSAARRLQPMRCDDCGVALERVFSPVAHLQRHVDAKQEAARQEAHRVGSLGNPLHEGLGPSNPWGADGFPLPGTSEELRQDLYAELLADGLSDSEARGTVWPEPRHMAQRAAAP